MSYFPILGLFLAEPLLVWLILEELRARDRASDNTQLVDQVPWLQATNQDTRLYIHYFIYRNKSTIKMNY